ncbi:MAG: hypothetical protein IPK58_15475 [Acidobacteria bacterium]|nr:hypothetical protein [Acidobacteriota bacterium]
MRTDEFQRLGHDSMTNMKKCPKCNQLFEEENIFCLEDGTPLVPAVEPAPTVSFPLSGEVPTQFVPHPVAAPQTAAGGPSKWLYLVIGVLSTALIAVTLFLVMRPGQESSKAGNTETGPAAQGANDSSLNPKANSSPTPGTVSATPQTNANTGFQKPVDPSITPAGAWSGDWKSKTTDFSARASFADDNGKVSGQIVWTLERTSNPKKIDKVGLTAVEYVQGTYNPVTRQLSLRGVRKDDPNGLVILDRYNLSLAENNRTMSGRSINGNFVLRR